MFSNYVTLYVCGLCSFSFTKAIADAADDPLIVTSYLEGPDANVNAAVSISEVKPEILPGVKSYSGFFNVNKNCGNNLFFWFFPAEVDWESSPVILWLNGTPGSTVMSGVFEEVGPLQVVNGRLVKMEHPWTRKFNVLFIDQPVGSGFSFTERECYPDSVKSAMRETFTALKQFFVMFHQLKTNQFYITGPYFVSHYGPSLAAAVLESNQQSVDSETINLQGVLIMNGRTTGECQDLSSMLYQLGMVDQRKRNEFKNIQNRIVSNVRNGRFLDASELENEMMNKLRVDTKLPSIYNFSVNKEVLHVFKEFINGDRIKKQIHVGVQRFNDWNEKVHAALLPEYYSSPKEGIQFLLNRGDIFIGFYHGQMDVSNPYASVNCFLKTIQWPQGEDFTAVRRSSFQVDDKVVGWTKVTGNLYHFLVRQAGRYMGFDLGETSLVLLELMLEPVKTNAILQPPE